MFTEQQLYVGILKKMPEKFATLIFKNTNISMGIQIEFYNCWSHWVNQFSDATNNTISNNDIQRSKSNLNVTEIHSNVHLEQPIIKTTNLQNRKALCLKDILSSGPYGPGVIAHYKIHNSFDEKIRKLLVEAFLHHCITKDINITKAECKFLSTEIQNTFNGEIAVRIFIFQIVLSVANYLSN